MTIPNLPPDPILTSWPASGHVVVFDLEYTAWEGSVARGWSEPHEHREVIQIGGVRIDATCFDVVDSFEVLVRPKINPTLSDYIVRLTGITDTMLEERVVSYAQGLNQLGRFAGTEVPLLANGSDGAVLRENCVIHNIPDAFPYGRVFNIRPALVKATGLHAEKLVSCELPGLLGIGPSCARHSALSDAIAIAAALRELRRRRAI